MRTARAFSVIELLVVIAIIAAILGIAIPVLSAAKRSAATSTCLSNLRQLASAFDMYAQQNGGRFPDDTLGVAWDDQLMPHLTSGDVFWCPADAKYNTTGNSYNWRNQFAVFDPACAVSNRDKASLRNTKLILVFESLAGRHEPATLSAATIDGSASPYAAVDFEANMEQKAE